MARQKGIFDDRTSQIEQLICGVKGDLQMLDQKMAAFQRKVHGSGTNQTYQVHARNVATALTTRLAEVTKDFQEALEWRTAALEQQVKRRDIYSAWPQGGSANLLARLPASASGADSVEGGGGGRGGGGMAMQQVYQSSRADAVQHVQETIGELATMFAKMAGLVAAQDEVVASLWDDASSTLANVEAGNEQIARHFKSMSSNRGLILKVLLILVFFVVFFVVFLA